MTVDFWDRMKLVTMMVMLFLAVIVTVSALAGLVMVFLEK